MKRVQPFLAALVAVPFLHASLSHNPRTVTATMDGVKLTLQVPSKTYQQNELARLSVRVQNVSKHTVYTRLGPQCADTNPSIEVLDASGNVTSPWPAGIAVHPCPYLLPEPFAAGKSWSAHPLAVIIGTSVRAVLTVWKKGSAQSHRLVTSAVPVTLTTGTAPVVTLSQSPQGPVATIVRPPNASGPLHALDSTDCQLPNGHEEIDASMLWYSVKGNQIRSGCAGKQEWHGWVGYVGYPVATIDYTSR